jgi:hypothetical protein
MMMPDEQLERFEQWIAQKKYAKTLSNQSFRSQATVYTIPVVFHILHKGEALGTGFNISNERIIEQVAILNQDFRKSNPRSSTVPALFKPVEADIEIEFVLARQTPDGFPTNGIVRKQGNQSTYNYPSESIKEESYWPSTDYLNIWVADLNNVLGWASYPQGVSDLPNPETTPEHDGVVIDGQYIGTNLNTGGLFESFGQTVTHEIGHFLGLHHIWGGSGCLSDDYCDDTPAAAGNNSGIKSPCTFPGPDSCTSDSFPDMFMNFMDYSDDACMSMFTEDQKARMRIVLENSPRRVSLLTSPGLEFPIGALTTDMAALSIEDLPTVSCEASLTPSVVFSNHGSDNVTSFKVAYTLNGNTQEIVISGVDLVTGEQYVLTPMLTGLTDGEQQVSWEITEVNGTGDENNLNDTQIRQFSINTESLTAPFKEGFTAHKWYNTSPNGTSQWQEQTLQGNDLFFVPAFNSSSTAESWLVSPTFDLRSFNEAGLFFKLSYGARTPSDVLDIKISTDCTEDFVTIASYDLDALGFITTASSWVPSSITDWKEFFVDLSAYTNNTNVRVAFVFGNNGGNNVYLDDIELTNNNDPLQPRIKSGSFIAYPNPTKNRFYLTINLPDLQDVRVQLIDIKGAIVRDEQYAQTLNQTYRMDTEQLFGTYFLRVTGKDINQTQRILIGR